MLADTLIAYLVFNLILLVVNVIGYTKLPFILIFTIIGTLLMAVPTVEGFGEDYYMFGILLLLINIGIPLAGLTKAAKGA